MKRWIHTYGENNNKERDEILCMSAARGNKIVNPFKQPFSFYFSGRNSSHSIRVKPVFNPDRIVINKAGTLKLSDDWNYIPGDDDKRIKSSDITKMKKFFRKYFVLFSLVWDFKLSDPILADYFEGRIDFTELLKDLTFYDEYNDELQTIKTVEELEEFLIATGSVNMYGN